MLSIWGMARATPILAATTVAGVALSLWLWHENRALRAELDKPAATGEATAEVSARTADPWQSPTRASGPQRSGAVPELPGPKEESRLARRARHTDELAEMFGRAEGETPDQYRARVMPMIKAGLAIPRQRAEDMRKEAEEKAHVTPQQSAQLDRAFDKVYGDAIDYANKAIADGELSPYERNVAGWLDFAGGLGGILTDAQTQIGQVLSPEQVKAMSDSGFEWGEYLGLEAPWEQLEPPPLRKQ